MDSSLAMQIIRKLIVCIMILGFLLFASNIAWIVAWCQYDYANVEIEQETEEDANFAVVNNKGDLTYDGTAEGTSSDPKKEEREEYKDTEPCINKTED